MQLYGKYISVQRHWLNLRKQMLMISKIFININSH
jgi:hypothetical protein